MNSAISSISPSLTLAVTARAREMRAQGLKVVNFAAGEPDFDTPDSVKKAAADALAAGKTKYAPVAGLPELRAEIARKLKDENGLDYEPSRIVVSNGAKHSLFNVIMALCDSGSEVIIPSPYWLSYPEMVRVAGAEPVFIEGSQADCYKISPSKLEGAITERTRALIINSPCNPTGGVYTADELRELCSVAADKGVYIISDEIYEKLIYDGLTHSSVAGLSDEIFEMTVTINGMSKAFSMTGWRLGYLAGPERLVKAVTAFQSHSTSGANTFAQYGGLEALKLPSSSLDEMSLTFDRRRVKMCESLSACKRLSFAKPGGAFYVFINISNCGLGSVDFTARLLEEEHVAAVPGAAFGSDDHVRLSYACGLEDIEEGCGRLISFAEGI